MRLLALDGNGQKRPHENHVNFGTLEARVGLDETLVPFTGYDTVAARPKFIPSARFLWQQQRAIDVPGDWC